MTKSRHPNTFQDAIIRIVDRIGWDGAADVVGKGERAIRNWSDPDMDREPTIGEAFELDAAYLEAGGSAPPPMMAVYSTRLSIRRAKPSDRAAIAVATSTAAKEIGEALAASVAAAQPDSGPIVLRDAEREIGEAIGALKTLQVKVAVQEPEHG